MAIRSVSAWPETRDEIQKMIEWTKRKLEALGTSIELVDIGNQTLSDGKVIKLPNVILGQLGNVSVFFLNSTHVILCNQNIK